jgi:hypothetical protein
MLELSDLPPYEQLKLHVDPLDFRKKLVDRIYWEERRGRIARRLLWNDVQQYWEQCNSEDQNKYWEQADKITEIIWGAFGMYIGLCGDTHKVPDEDRKSLIDTAEIDDVDIALYAKKLHEFLHKYKIGQAGRWHNCISIEWDKIDRDALEWLISTTRLAFTPFRDIDIDNTPYYLTGTLES